MAPSLFPRPSSAILFLYPLCKGLVTCACQIGAGISRFQPSNQIAERLKRILTYSHCLEASEYPRYVLFVCIILYKILVWNQVYSLFSVMVPIVSDKFNRFFYHESLNKTNAVYMYSPALLLLAKCTFTLKFTYITTFAASEIRQCVVLYKMRH